MLPCINCMNSLSWHHQDCNFQWTSRPAIWYVVGKQHNMMTRFFWATLNIISNMISAVWLNPSYFKWQRSKHMPSFCTRQLITCATTKTLVLSTWLSTWVVQMSKPTPPLNTSLVWLNCSSWTNLQHSCVTTTHIDEACHSHDRTHHSGTTNIVDVHDYTDTCSI